MESVIIDHSKDEKLRLLWKEYRYYFQRLSRYDYDEIYGEDYKRYLDDFYLKVNNKGIIDMTIYDEIKIIFHHKDKKYVYEYNLTQKELILTYTEGHRKKYLIIINESKIVIIFFPDSGTISLKMYIYDDERKIEGDSLISYYTNNTLKSIEYSYDKITEGPYKSWYDDGEVEYYIFYTNGIYDGYFYHYNRESNSTEEGYYEEGEEVGLWKFWNNGIYSEKEYKMKNPYRLVLPNYLF